MTRRVDWLEHLAKELYVELVGSMAATLTIVGLFREWIIVDMEPSTPSEGFAFDTTSKRGKKGR